MAASLHKLAISAPLKPGVKDASLLPYSSFVYLLESFKGLKWTRKISNLPLRSGKLTSTSRSNRPGLTSAGSRIYFLLVAPITTTLLLPSNPSISTSSWFRVLYLSSLPPMLFERFFPIASSSSMKMIAAFSAYLALLNKSLTREAPTPTYISTKSEPETE